MSGRQEGACAGSAWARGRRLHCRGNQTRSGPGAWPPSPAPSDTRHNLQAELRGLNECLIVLCLWAQVPYMWTLRMSCTVPLTRPAGPAQGCRTS